MSKLNTALLKKSLLFVIHYLELGGAERSLIGLLGSLDYSLIDVYLFVNSHRGELMKEIPPQVHLLPEIPKYAQIERPMKDVLKDGYWQIVLARLRAKWQFFCYKRKKHPKEGSAIFSYVMKNVVPYLPSIMPEKEYDLAVSFLTPHDVVKEKVCAKKKVAWIHTDYSRIDVDRELEQPVWGAFDHVVAVSQGVKDSFIDIFPALKSKVMVIENILSPGYVYSRANAVAPAIVELELHRREGSVTLLSIGRYTAAKNFDNVPDICRRILKKGLSVCWYILGYGGDEALIRQAIADAEMEGYVFLLGKKENPYPYIKACDIYIQPSRFEGNAVTVREAQILGKPVVVTDYPTARNQVLEGQNGIIVPLDNEGCAKGIASLISDREKQGCLSSFCLSHDFGNEKEVERLYSLL